MTKRMPAGLVTAVAAAVIVATPGTWAAASAAEPAPVTCVWIWTKDEPPYCLPVE